MNVQEIRLILSSRVSYHPALESFVTPELQLCLYAIPEKFFIISQAIAHIETNENDYPISLKNAVIGLNSRF